jgi:hypothetical protein
MPHGVIKPRFGAFVGGMFWAVAMRGRWWIERDLGWWHSGLAEYPDPLFLFTQNPLSLIVCWISGNALVLVFFMIGRRFGAKGQAIGLVLFGLVQPLLERIWFSKFIPAMEFRPGIAPALGSAGMLIAAGIVAILLMRLIGGRNASSDERK